MCIELSASSGKGLDSNKEKFSVVVLSLLNKGKVLIVNRQ